MLSDPGAAARDLPDLLPLQGQSQGTRGEPDRLHTTSIARLRFETGGAVVFQARSAMLKELEEQMSSPTTPKILKAREEADKRVATDQRVLAGISNRCVYMGLGVVFLAYPIVSHTILQSFSCRVLDEG